MPARTLDLKEGWIVISHIGWGVGHGNRFKNLKEKPESESLRRTISASHGPRSLQCSTHLTDM